MTERYPVCPVSDLPPGERRIVDAGGRSIGVFNVDGEFYALRNDCPHQRAPLCEGTLTGTVRSPAVGEYEWEREGRVIRCPWHGWEFDVTTGESVFNPHRWKTRTYEAAVEPMEGDADDADDGDENEKGKWGTSLRGDEPPVDTYDVEVDEGIVVVYA